MDTQIQRSNSSSGGVHVCRKCGWPFPKPHPSSRHRRAHKKVCGSIEGYARFDYGDEVASDDDSRGETLTDGSKSVEKSARRGGSEEELFTDAVTEFADVNVAIADAGNLFPPSSANGARVLTPEREGAGIDTPLQQNLSSSSVDSVPSTGLDPKEGENLDCKSEEVAEEKRFGLDGKTDSSEKSFRATGDANEEAGRRLETFTSCNDRFYNMAETDHLLSREHSVVVLEDCEDQTTEIGEKVDNSEIDTRNFLDDIDSLAKSMKGVRPDEVTDLAKEESTLMNEKFSADGNEVRSGEVEKISEFSLVGQVEKEREFEHEFPVVLLESKGTVHEENNVTKNLQESEAGNNAISGTDDNVDSTQSLAVIKERDLDQGEQEETVAPVGIQVDSDSVKRDDVGSNGETCLIEEKGLSFGERKFEHELPVVLLESKDAIHVENVLKNLQESEAGDSANSGTDDYVDSKQRRDLDQGEQEETVVAVGIQVDSDAAKHAEVGSNGETCLIEEKDGDMNLPKEDLSESAPGIQVDSSESKDTIAVENNVQKGLQESEAGNNAISVTAGNVDLTQSLAITEEGDLDQGKQEETVAGSNSETHSIEDNEGMISGLTDGDVNLTKEEETVSTYEGIISSDGGGNLVKQEEMATVSALDVQADASSQTNSLEGNWGSASAATETETLPPQAPATVQAPILPPGSDTDKQETSLVKPNEGESGQNQGPTETQAPQIPPGSKKIEEIGTEKRHMPLKSFLGDEPSPPKNPPAKEAGKEWNSPARYPTNIKREKRKGRSRGWVPFICCSSAQTS